MAHWGLLPHGGWGKLCGSRRAMNDVKLMEKSYSNIEMKQEDSLSRESMR
jgi:hypothetical protein